MPISTPEHPVGALADQLNASFARAAEIFAETGRGVTAWVALDPLDPTDDDKGLEFGYGRHEGKWGFYVRDNAGHVWPLEQAKREWRMAAASRLAALDAACDAAAEDMGAALQRATAVVHRWVHERERT